MILYVPKWSMTIDASNVAASTKTAWSNATTYAASDQVKYQVSGDLITREYESLKATNLNHAPAVGGTEWWADLGPQNRDKMFDGLNNSRTVADTGDDRISVKITPSHLARSVALLGLRNATSVTIKQFASPEDTEPLTAQTFNLLHSNLPVGWYTWLFGSYPYTYRRSLIVPLAGLYFQPCVQIDIIGGTAECGQCFFAMPYDLGCTADGASPSLLSYSTFQPDEYGHIQYVPRQNTRELNFTLWTQTDRFNNIFSLLETLESELVLIDANHHTAPDETDFDALRVYGKITSLRPGLAYAMTPIDIRIQGLD